MKERPSYRRVKLRSRSGVQQMGSPRLLLRPSRPRRKASYQPLDENPPLGAGAQFSGRCRVPPYYPELVSSRIHQTKKKSPRRRRMKFVRHRRKTENTESSVQFSTSYPFDWTIPNMLSAIRQNRRVRAHPSVFTPPGLINPNNLCYRNSTVQFLMNLPPLAAWFEAWHDSEVTGRRHCTLGGKGCLTCLLGCFTRLYWTPGHELYKRRASFEFGSAAGLLNRIVDSPVTIPDEFTVNNQPLPSFQSRLQTLGAGRLFEEQGGNGDLSSKPLKYLQHDPVELLNWLLDFVCLNGRHNLSTTQTEIKRLCEVRYYETRKCAFCAPSPSATDNNQEEKTKPGEEGTWIMNLYLGQASSGPTTISDVIARNLQDPYEKHCDACGNDHGFSHNTVLTHLPEILTFSIIRTDNYGRKIARRMELSDEIDLQPFVDQRSNSRFARDTTDSVGAEDGGTRYRLQAMIQHYGTAEFGHYKASARRADGEWYTMEDAAAVVKVNGGLKELACQKSRIRRRGLEFYPAILGYVKVVEGEGASNEEAEKGIGRKREQDWEAEAETEDAMKQMKQDEEDIGNTSDHLGLCVIPLPRPTSLPPTHFPLPSKPTRSPPPLPPITIPMPRPFPYSQVPISPSPSPTPPSPSRNVNGIHPHPQARSFFEALIASLLHGMPLSGGVALTCESEDSDSDSDEEEVDEMRTL